MILTGVESAHNISAGVDNGVGVVVGIENPVVDTFGGHYNK